MQVAKTSSQSFGIKLTYNMKAAYAHLRGAKATNELVERMSHIGAKNVYVCGFNEMSLYYHYNSAIQILKDPFTLKPEELTEIQTKLLRQAMKTAAKQGNLQQVTDELRADYADLGATIDAIYNSKHIRKINDAVTEFRAKHPVLYALGFRPSKKNIH